MSLIHEALQKAEAERRAGELPSLSLPMAPTRRRRSRTGWWLGMGAISVLAGVLGYVNRDLIRDTLTHENAAPAASPQKPESLRDAPAATAEIPNPPDIPEGPPAAPPPDAAEQARLAEIHRLAAERAAQAEAAEAKAMAQSAPEVQFDPNALKPRVAPTQPDGIAATPELTEPAAAAPVDPAPPQAPPAAPASISEGAASAPVDAVAGAPKDPATSIPNVYDLPFSARRELPKLKVSMHVFHQEPEQRFAIINGKRINEGGPVENELDLVSIQREGLVLRFRGQEFFLPRAGY